VSKAGGTELAVLASELDSARQERDVLREQLQNTQLSLESLRVEMTVCLGPRTSSSGSGSNGSSSSSCSGSFIGNV